MDPCLDRYISYEYLVSPCPEGSRSGVDGERRVCDEVKRAVGVARERLRAVKMQVADPSVAAAMEAAEAELNRAAALLDSFGGGWAT